MIPRTALVLVRVMGRGGSRCRERIVLQFPELAPSLTPYLFTAGALLVIITVAGVSRPTPPGGVRLDGTRLFSADTRREGFRRAGGQCEMETLPGIRCPRPATTGDHWFPHALGGATTSANFVATCAACNGRKSAKIPSRAMTWRLEARRRRYFPQGAPVSAGAWRN